MIIIAYISFILIIIQLLVSIINLIFRQKFSGRLDKNDLVSILIPVRNEEKNISALLKDLLLQDYKNIEIILFNDQSLDNTEKIIKDFAQKYDKIQYINSEYLPEGWLGKNYACYNLAKFAKGKYLLFIDADVRIKNDIIEKSISYMCKYNLSLFSIFPKQEMQTFGEKITVPLMNYILLTLLPLIFVRKFNFVSLAAANGQFMLFNSEHYKLLQPHEKMKDKKVEDIEIARYYKKNKYKIACITNKSDVRCRMYNSFDDAVNGFAKNVTHFFGNSYLLSFLFWFLTTFGAFFVLIYLDSEKFFIYVLMFFILRIIVSKISNQNVIDNLIYSLLQQLILGLIIIRSLILKKTNRLKWKERNI